MLFFFVRISLLEDFRRLLFGYLCSFALSVLTYDTATIVQFNMRVFARPRVSPLNCCNAQHFFITSGRLEEIELFSFRFTRGQYL